MPVATAATFRMVGGAVVGFETNAAVTAEIVDRLGFAEPTATTQPALLQYRSVRHHGRHGGDVFERHDEQREPPVERIGTSVDELIDDLHLGIALHATDDVFVHAGVVEWNGRAILLPGRSHAGKSTLVHELLRAGATYLSDEYARITTNAMIAPYPRPLQLRTPKGRRLVDPHHISTVATESLTPGLIVFTHHRAGASFAPASVSPAHAALDLFDNTVIAAVAPTRAARAVAQIARCSMAVRSERGGADLAAAAILSLVDDLAVAS
jgi:hypothetical protein